MPRRGARGQPPATARIARLCSFPGPGLFTLLQHGVGAAVMDVIGCEHGDSAMAVLGVVPREERPAEGDGGVDIVESPGEVYVAGERLNLSVSLAVARHSALGFGWGDGVSGGTQLALLVRATDRTSAVAHYQAFKWEVIRAPVSGLHLGGLHGPRLDCLALPAVNVHRPGETR